MTIESRLKKLEAKTPKASADPQARQRLHEYLQTTYERLDPNDITETWLAMQSNATAMAIAMFGVHPFPEFLTERLRQMSKIDGATGLMAKRISEIAT